MGRLIVAVCLMAATLVAAAQEPPSPKGSAAESEGVFEVATLKQNTSGAQGSGVSRLPGGRVTVTNLPVRVLIGFAYSLGPLSPFQLVGGPSWLADDRFDITAKMKGNPEWGGIEYGTPDPGRVAMQKFLADRFKLKVHTEMRDLEAYALVMVKPGTLGPALKPSTTDCKALLKQEQRGTLQQPQVVNGIMPCRSLGRIGQMSMDGFEMKIAAMMFVDQAGRPVVDRTGLTGPWQFRLTFFQERPANLPPEGNAPAPDPNAPPFFTAIQDQLGLKLESTKAPIEVIVIDSAEHPADD